MTTTSMSNITFNQNASVRFLSDRADLVGRRVQAVYRTDRSLELWQPEANGSTANLYRMADATMSLESGTRIVRKTPTWAIVLAVLGALFFLLGLLFLLVKENRDEPTNQARFVDPSGRTLILDLS
jgi:hypothetical protein